MKYILIAITAILIFIAGYMFSYYKADFTMSDAQAKAYCEVSHD